jgi:hypothetical protein
MNYFRLLIIAGLLYGAAAGTGGWVVQYMQRQLEVRACQQAAAADGRGCEECLQLARQPIAFLKP